MQQYDHPRILEIALLIKLSHLLWKNIFMGLNKNSYWTSHPYVHYVVLMETAIRLVSSGTCNNSADSINDGNLSKMH